MESFYGKSDLLFDSSIWGESYFTHGGGMVNFFAAHVAKVARYALPSVSHLNKMIKVEVGDSDTVMRDSGLAKIFRLTLKALPRIMNIGGKAIVPRRSFIPSRHLALVSVKIGN